MVSISISVRHVAVGLNSLLDFFSTSPQKTPGHFFEITQAALANLANSKDNDVIDYRHNKFVSLKPSKYFQFQRKANWLLVLLLQG